MYIIHLYRKITQDMEFCFNIETSEQLTEEEISKLQFLLADGFISDTVNTRSNFASAENNVIELGPRMNFATAWSSNMVSICQATGLGKVTRIERSRRYLIEDNTDHNQFIAGHHDRMTECVYP